MNSNDMVDISVEVEALNLDGIKQNLLNYVEKEVEIDIVDDVERAEKAAQDATEAAQEAIEAAQEATEAAQEATGAATEAVASAEVASDCARQTSASLGLYYTKSEADALLNTKQNSLTFDTTPTNASTNPVTSGGVYTALSGKANAATTLSGYGITDGANTALSNLSADGQMIINSANGTVSNCVLEIPQNVKCTITGGVITLASGSILTRTGSTYATYTTTDDIIRDIAADSLADGNYIVFASHASIHQPRALSDISSGTTFPTSNLGNLSVFFNTDDKVIYRYLPASNEWTTLSDYYPICEITIASGVVSFAKDSNDRDIIFNGACFIGGHAVIYPGIKSFTPEGLEDNGTLHSALRSSSALAIVALSSGTTATGFRKALNSFLISGAITKIYYAEFNNRDEAPLSTAFRYCYIKDENRILQYANNRISISHVIPFIFYEYDGTAVSDFTIQQPIRTVNTYMLDKKQNDITSITGYDATKTQTLKNVSGTLTWVDD